MDTSTFFRNWWVILIQGLLMIALSVLIFNNPGAVLITLAFWLGIVVLVTGLYGVIAWFATAKNDRDTAQLLYSIVVTFIGFLMISKVLVSMIAITVAFGALVCMIGLVLISGSWKARKLWSMWWVVALIGVVTAIIGVKSIFDVETGAESISTLIGLSVLLAGIGLVFLAFLKRKVVKAVEAL